MSNFSSRGSYFWALGLLGFLPPHCGLDWPGDGTGGSSGTGNEPSAGAPSASGGASGAEGGAPAEGGAAGEGGAAAAGGATAGGPSEAGGSGAPGEGGGPATPADRVTEPLLGCTHGVSGKLTPGTFELLPPPPGRNDRADPWSVTDWSGDGQSAVGYYKTPPADGSYGSITFQWRAKRGYEIISRVSIDLASSQEEPTALTSCDGSVSVLRLGQGELYVEGPGPSVATEQPPSQPYFHDYLTLSEDGSSVSYLTGIRDQIRPWTEWRSTKGDIASITLDEAESISWDGLTLFGISSCYYEQCTPLAVFRWRPLEGYPDVTVGAPTPYVAADGESVVYDFQSRFIGIWRESGTETIACGQTCGPIAWSARARVILVLLDGDGYALWTRAHGFRLLTDLLNIPAGVSLSPTGLSLDGWTVTGTAVQEDGEEAPFRATLPANAFQ